MSFVKKALFGAVAAVALAMVPAAKADTVLEGTVKYLHQEPGSASSGGPFHFQKVSDLTALATFVDGSIVAFFADCVENNPSNPEYIYSGELVKGVISNIWNPGNIMSSEAKKGGVNTGPVGPSGGDLLDPRSAWLFTQWYNGVSGYSSADVQNAIWKLEEENYTDAGNLTTLIANATAANPTNLGSVRVLNLYGMDGTLRQSQVVMTTLPGQGVPLPAAAWTGIVMLGAFGAVRAIRIRREA